MTVMLDDVKPIGFESDSCDCCNGIAKTIDAFREMSPEGRNEMS